MNPTIRVLVVLLCLGLAGCATNLSSPSPDGQSIPPPSASPSTSGPVTSTTPATPTSVPSPSPTGLPTPTASPTGLPTPSIGPDGSFDPNAVALDVQLLAIGFRPLTFATHAGDGSGRLFAVEQRGIIWTLDQDGAVSATPFLDITDLVGSGGERGLLGLAFHPDFASNGRFFVDYTNKAGNTVVAEYGLLPGGNGDPASGLLLLSINQPYSNHNGGMIAFGSDGYLYIASGDGGSAEDPQGNGQRLDTLLGKILRIDVDSGAPYGIPSDNPFADDGGRPEIWDWGMRNPWRFSFDRLTGDLFVGDVGQDTREEINAEPAGDGGHNYGWNTVEGDRCLLRPSCSRAGLTAPVVVYGRDGNCSVTGGYVYRGAQFPVLSGAYIFSDYCSGKLWAISAATAITNGSARMFELGDTTLNPTSFGEDEAGELYLVHAAGEIYRLVATPR